MNNNQTQRHIDSVNRKFENGKIKKKCYLQCLGTYNLICTIHLCTPSSRLAAVALCTHYRPVVLCHTKHILLFDISCPDHRKEHYTVWIFCFFLIFKIFFSPINLNSNNRFDIYLGPWFDTPYGRASFVCAFLSRNWPVRFVTLRFRFGDIVAHLTGNVTLLDSCVSTHATRCWACCPVGCNPSGTFDKTTFFNRIRDRESGIFAERVVNIFGGIV